MIKLLPNMPDHVVGVTASGRVDAADYETVLIPAIVTDHDWVANAMRMFAAEVDADGIDCVKRVGSGVLFSGLLSADRDL